MVLVLVLVLFFATFNFHAEKLSVWCKSSKQKQLNCPPIITTGFFQDVQNSTNDPMMSSMEEHICNLVKVWVSCTSIILENQIPGNDQLSISFDLVYWQLFFFIFFSSAQYVAWTLICSMKYPSCFIPIQIFKGSAEVESNRGIC